MYLAPRTELELPDTYWSQLIFAWNIIFLVIAIGSVTARIYCRYLKGNRYAWDDALIVGALVCYIAQCILVFFAIFIGGVGHSDKKLKDPERELPSLLKLITALQYPYAVSLGLVRGSICVLLLRIFGVIGRTFRYCIYFGIFITVTQSLFVIFTASFICRPFAANWNKAILQTDPSASCGDSTAYYIQTLLFAIAIDVYIFLLPIPQVLGLNMQKVHKFLLVAVFALGLLDVLVAVFRIFAIKQIKFTDPNTDVTISITEGIIWGIAEPSIAILVACAPILKPLVQKLIFNRMVDSTKSALSWGQSALNIPQSSRNPNRAKTRGSVERSARADDELELVPTIYGKNMADSAVLPKSQLGQNEYEMPLRMREEAMKTKGRIAVTESSMNLK